MNTEPPNRFTSSYCFYLHNELLQCIQLQFSLPAEVWPLLACLLYPTSSSYFFYLTTANAP